MANKSQLFTRINTLGKLEGTVSADSGDYVFLLSKEGSLVVERRDPNDGWHAAVSLTADVVEHLKNFLALEQPL